MSPTAPPDPQTKAKQHAAKEALRLVQSGMTVGLGSGSTATLFIEALGDAVRDGSIRDIVGIPTSRESERLAKSVGIPIGDFATHHRCHVTIDGADEVDPALDLIKGLGGAMLREKLVAQNSERLIIIVDAAKRVQRLGTKGPLPVEVTPFGLPAHERFLKANDAIPTLRKAKDGSGPYLTDNGNYILDCRFENGIADARSLATKLQDRAGIVQHGLFLGIAHSVIVATKDGGVETMERRN